MPATTRTARALALARRYRDLGAAVARDIIIRGLEDSLAYARQQRAREQRANQRGGERSRCRATRFDRHLLAAEDVVERAPRHRA